MSQKNIKKLLIAFIWFYLIQAPAFAQTLNLNSNSSNDEWIYTVVKGDYLQRILNDCCEPSLKPNIVAKLNQISNVDLLTPGQIIRIPASFLKSKPINIIVLVASGDVQIKHFGHTSYEVLQDQALVSEGDLIKTGAKSIARLKFEEDSVLLLQPNSLLSIQSSRQRIQNVAIKVKVKLLEGRAEIAANPEHAKNRSFEVQTPSAVAVVRGTEFRVNAHDELTAEETLSGAVDFKVGSALVAVTQDFGSTAKVGEPPTQPSPLPDMPSLVNLKENIEYLPVELEIAPQKQVGEFLAQLATDEAFNELIDERVVPAIDAEVSILTFKHLPDGKYFLKLRAKDNLGLESRDKIVSFNVEATPYPPDPMIKPNNIIDSESAHIFRWTPLADATGYVIQFAKDEAFNEVTFTRFVAYNQFAPVQSLPQGSHYWRVAAKSNTTQKFSKVVPVNH